MMMQAGGRVSVVQEQGFSFDPMTVTAEYMAAHTGAPAGTSFQTFSGTLVDGMSFDGYEWTNGLTIPAGVDNLTFENCRFTGGDYWGIDGSSSSGLTFRRCTIIGEETQIYNYALLAGQNCTVELCDVSVHQHAIGPGGGTSGLVRWNYVHDPYVGNPVWDKHVGGVSIKGGTPFANLIVEENLIFGQDTAGIFIKNDFGDCTDTIVRRNRVQQVPGQAYGYACYSTNDGPTGDVSGTQFLDNVLERGSFATFSIYDNPDCITDGNVNLLGVNVDDDR